MLTGLGFLAPAFLFAALAVALPIALHLFGRRTDDVVHFPAVRLLQREPVERRRLRQPRDWWLLLLRVTALLLLAAGFARPYWTGTAVADSPVTVVAVDSSMSLSAPGQMQAARQAARAAVDAAPPGAAVALMAFDDTARVVVPPTRARGDIRQALDALTAGAGGTRYAAVVGEAATLFGASGGELVIVTDVQTVGWNGEGDRRVPDGVRVRVSPVPAPTGNLAVVAATTSGGGLTALVQNYGEGPREARVHLLVDGREVASATRTVRPGATVEVPLDVRPPDGVRVQLRVDDAEGYPADNDRYLSVDGTEAVPVLLVTAAASSAPPFVQRALEAGGPGPEMRVTRVAATALGSVPEPAPGRDAVVILLGTRGLDREARSRLAAVLKAGGRVWVTAGPDLDVPALASALGAEAGLGATPLDGPGLTSLVPVDPRHPVFRVFEPSASALAEIDVWRVLPLVETAGWRVLARFAGGTPALAERRIGQGRLVVFTSDLEGRWNRLPLRPGFVPFVREVVREMAAAGDEPDAATIGALPAGVPAVPGHQTVMRNGRARTVAVNVDVRESDPAAGSAEIFLRTLTDAGTREPSRPGAAHVRDDEDRQRLWQWIFGLVLVVLIAESLLGRAPRVAGLTSRIGASR